MKSAAAAGILLAAGMVLGCGKVPSLPLGKSGQSAAAQPAAPDAGVSDGQDASSVPDGSPLPDAVVVYDDHGKRDPFVPPRREQAYSVDKRAALQLEMIIQGGDRPLAVISGERVTVGDTIQGCVVKEIANGRVTLEFEGESFAITAN